MLPHSDFPTFKMGIVPFVLVASSAYGLVVTALAGEGSLNIHANNPTALGTK